jgi:hypothetical protein
MSEDAVYEDGCELRNYWMRVSAEVIRETL